MRARYSTRSHVWLALSAGLIASCTSPSTNPRTLNDRAASLVIVGSSEIFAPAGQVVLLSVKYEDRERRAKPGTVTFEIRGVSDAQFDGNNGSNSVFTGAEGIATIGLRADPEGDTDFQVAARAPDADEVFWRVLTPNPATEVVGTFELESRLDLGTGFVGPAGSVISFLGASDASQIDPASIILEPILEQTGFLGTILVSGAANFLNSIIGDVAPQFVVTMLNVATQFRLAASQLGLTTRLKADDANPFGTTTQARQYTATHWLQKAFYVVNGLEVPFNASQLSTDRTLSVSDVRVFYEQNLNQLIIGEHNMPFPYGELLLRALNDTIVRNVAATTRNQFARDMSELLLAVVDCKALGERFFNFSSEFQSLTRLAWQGACTRGLKELGEEIEEEIADLGDSAVLRLEGRAGTHDQTGDRRPDRIFNGTWQGFLQQGGFSAPIQGTNQRFDGKRVSD